MSHTIFERLGLEVLKLCINATVTVNLLAAHIFYNAKNNPGCQSTYKEWSPLSLCLNFFLKSNGELRHCCSLFHAPHSPPLPPIAPPPFDLIVHNKCDGKKILRCRPLAPPDEGLPPPFAPPKKKKKLSYATVRTLCVTYYLIL